MWRKPVLVEKTHLRNSNRTRLFGVKRRLPAFGSLPPGAENKLDQRKT